MKSEDLLRNIGSVDNKYVDELYEEMYAPAKKKKKGINWGALAASVALIAFGCFAGSLFMFRKELRLASWGVNIRMAIATVIIFWCPVEIMARLQFFTEIWVQPEKYKAQMITILIAFIVLLAYVVYVAVRKPKK